MIPWYKDTHETGEEKITYSNFDFKNLVTKKDISTEFEHKVLFKFNDDVIQWLHHNIKPSKTCNGWCIGDDKFNSNEGLMGMTVWFFRRKDALAFIKQFSEYKKPTSYYNQFTETRKFYNPKTNTLQDVE
jgi:hypothetical protein